MGSVLRYGPHDGIPFWEDADNYQTLFRHARNSKLNDEPILENDKEYEIDDLPLQPIGKYVVCMKCDCADGRFVAGLNYNAFKCASDEWMLETDNGTYMWIERSQFELISVFKKEGS